LEVKMIQDINRRVVLQSLGLGSATLLVGCNVATPDIADNTAIAALSTQNQVTTCPGNISLTVKVKKGESAAEQEKYAVLKVEFYRGKVLLGTITTAPFTLTIEITPENLVKYEDDGEPEDEDKCGYYAKVFYKSGKVQTTDRIRVIVDKTCTPGTTDTTPPMVNLASSSVSVLTDGKITLTATATDETGGSGLAKVDFLEGTTLLGSATAAPFAFDINFTQTNNGTHNYIAKAYDKAGNFASSTPSVSVVVNIPGTPPTDTTAPVVTLSSSSLNVMAAGSITLTAGATDNAGGSGIASLELFDGTTSLGVKTAAPFTWARMLTLSDNGTKVYTAKATDKAGNVGTSPTVSVTVNIATTPPTIALAAAPTNITAAGSSTLTATVVAGSGAISKVDFYEGATLLGTKTTAPYTYAPAYTSANNGTHTYTAKVTASDGSTATSAAATVTVNIAVTTGTLIALYTALAAAGSYVNFTHPTSGIKCILYRAATAQTGGVSNAGAFYVAYSRKCTHAGTIITNNPNTANPHVLTCQDHGATYNMDSNCAPINGIAPAALPSIVIKAGTDGIYI
jgi:Rieske Fe-S protein